jgi:hypothetical protein
MTPASLNLHYRAPAAAAWCVRGFLTFGVLMGAGQPQRDSRLGVRARLLRMSRWHHGVDRVADAAHRVYESAEGLRFVHSLGSETFRWDSIARFEHSPTRPRSQVLVVGHDDRRHRPIGTAQGCRITWDDGETDDIVGGAQRAPAPVADGGSVSG